MSATPTLDEWKKLYALAVRIKEMEPWNWMREEKVFGVRNPERDEIGFLSVMGAGGEHFAITLYQGAGALYSIMELRESATEDYDEIDPSSIIEIPQLMVSYESHGHLQKEDRFVLKQLGLKFRGANSWPIFRSYGPGLFPWFLTSTEARFMTTALEQFIDVASRYRDDENLLPEAEGNFLVRVPRAENARLVWEETIMFIPEPEDDLVFPTKLAPELIEKLKNLPEVTNVIEIGFSKFPIPVREKKERPYFPYLLMLADSYSGMVLINDMLQPLPSMGAMMLEIPIKIAEHLLQLDVRPGKIVVKSAQLADLISTLEEAGIRIKLAKSLPAVDAATEFFLERMAPPH